MITDDVAQAVWEYSTRTLVNGNPDSPTNKTEEIAKAVWEYASRYLTLSKTSFIRIEADISFTYTEADVSFSRVSGEVGFAHSSITRSFVNDMKALNFSREVAGNG